MYLAPLFRYSRKAYWLISITPPHRSKSDQKIATPPPLEIPFANAIHYVPHLGR